MKMYKIRSWGFEIEEIEITRKTDSSVWYMYGSTERREANTYYFETWEAAKQELINRNTKDLQDAERAVERAKEQLHIALNLTRAVAV